MPTPGVDDTIYLRVGNPDTYPNFSTLAAVITYLKTQCTNATILDHNIFVNVQGGQSFGVDGTINSFTNSGSTAYLRFGGFTIEFRTDPADLAGSGPGIVRGGWSFGQSYGGPSVPLADSDTGTLRFNGLKVTSSGTISMFSIGPSTHAGYKIINVVNCVSYFILSSTNPTGDFVQAIGLGGGAKITLVNTSIFAIFTNVNFIGLYVVDGGTANTLYNCLIALWCAAPGAITVRNNSSALVDSNALYAYSGHSLAGGFAAGQNINTQVGNPNLVDPVITSVSDSIATMMSKNAQPTAGTSSVRGHANITYAPAVDILGRSRS